MAPPTRSGEFSPEYTKEYNEFMAKLKVYHENRGTRLDPEPRVSQKPVDLFRLFNVIVDRGGYDKISAEKLAWRTMSQLFGLGGHNEASNAFMLKTLYYKNLAAYEISTIHGKEPPPKEILEETTAKGGNLLSRTLDNFHPTVRREASTLRDGMSGESGDDGTPVRERQGSEETPGSGGRATRGLRQAPPQRVLFQPDTLPARQSHRHTNTPTAVTTTTPSTSQTANRGASSFHNPSNNTEPMSSTLANYEPSGPQKTAVQPVITPANDPVGFARQQRLLQEAAAASDSRNAPAPRMMLPGTGFDGPNIYVRCLLSLKSGIPAEVDYALHHLVKISMERGDKYRFESFPGLAEALIEKILEVTSLFYDMEWEISYLDDGSMPKDYCLDGVKGTAGMLERIAKLVQKGVDDNIQTEEFSNKLLQINEAALTLRNMVMLEENALYVSSIFPLRDCLSVVLQLPRLDSVVELKHYALEIAEQITKYLHFDSIDPLYLSLVKQLDFDEDRGAMLTSLRAISRISMNLEERNRLQNIPVASLQQIFNYTLLAEQDEELVHAALDFLYQYTAVVENVDLMVNELHLDQLIRQLDHLLMHGAKEVEHLTIVEPERRIPGPETLPGMPRDLMQELLKMEEPHRSSQWLMCFFEEDKDESITQIALWQAYSNQFANVPEPAHPILPAADFIKNVSNTFLDKATAQVQQQPTPKFIIKGIRMRVAPLNLQGQEYTKCSWVTSALGPSNAQAMTWCNDYFLTQEQMYNHILDEHLHIPRDENGKYIPKPMEFACRWSDCSMYSEPVLLKAHVIGSHVQSHCRRAIPESKNKKDPNAKPSWIIPAVTTSKMWLETAVDERGDAAGIPLSAVLVLRNLARNLHKTEAEELALKEPGGVSLVHRFFKPSEPGLFYIFAHNRALGTYLTDLLFAIRR